ncbi:MAG: TolC family protein [Nitratireductor sp.]
MNLNPSDHYHLVIPTRKMSSLNVKIPSSEMVRLALQNRPELRELSYQARINENEAEAALLELLPGIQLFASGNYDSNVFSYNSDWVNVGAKASWNLMKLFSYPTRKGVFEAEANLNDQRSLAMTMAIMTQVEVSRVRYGYLKKSAKTAAEYNNVQQKILKHVKVSASSGAQSEQSLIREEMNALISSAKYDIAYADLQNAFAGIYSSIGVDPWGDYLDLDADVATLTSSLKQTWNKRGDTGG